MKIFAVNGSPRKKGNTATVLEHFLEGARSAGADTELIHLYDLQASGCRSCFACKLRGGASYGHCALKDDLSPVLAALEKADGLALGSPVYFGNVTGAMRSFQERLCFPYLVYDRRRSTIAPRRLAMACIYTMNVDAETMRQHGYPETLAVMDGYLGRIFSTPSVLYVTDTWQFDDYARYVADRFSEADKRRRREEQFPQECRQAFVMGQEMVQKLAGQGGPLLAAGGLELGPHGLRIHVHGVDAGHRQTAGFHFWRREPGSPVGVLHPAGQPEEGLLLGEACALGCTGPLRLTAAEHALLGSCPAEGLAFFLCLGSLPEEPGRAELRVCAVLAVALDGGRALRLSLPQELPERLPMTRLAAASPA